MIGRLLCVNRRGEKDGQTDRSEIAVLALGSTDVEKWWTCCRKGEQCCAVLTGWDGERMVLECWKEASSGTSSRMVAECAY